MKICMVGLGSIGIRHLKNLPAVLSARNEEFTIDALRSSSRRLIPEVEGLLQNQFYSISDLPDDYDVAFICSPTSEHTKMIQSIASKAKHLFIEKPVFNNPKDLEKITVKDGSVYYVACPLRYSRILRTLKNIIEDKTIFSVRVISSTFLPEWRPNTDYRKIYSAISELGGGVELDMIHEWDYIIWLFGFPQAVQCYLGKYSDLDIDSNDAAMYIAKYKDKLVNVYLDYFGKVWRREVEFCVKDDVITADLIHQQIRFLKDNIVLDLSEDRDVMQKRELDSFFDMIAGNCENQNTIETAAKVLSIAKGEYRP